MSIPSKRVIRWTLYLACLALLGVGIYRFEPHEPRWTVDGDDAVVNTPIRFSANGEQVYVSPFSTGRHAFDFTTYLWDFNLNAPPPRRLRTFDLGTGTLASEHPATGRLTATNEFSKDGRYFAAVCEWQKVPAEGGERFVCLVDLQTDEEHRLVLPCSLDEAPLHFSPCSQYLIVGLTDQEGPVQIYECATGQLLEERYCWGLLWNAVFEDGHLLYVEKDDAEQRHIVRWNLRDRKFAETLFTIKDHAFVKMIGNFLVVQGEQAGQWVTWNMRTRKIECEWHTELTGASSLSQLICIGERNYACIDVWSQSMIMLEAWDIQTGKRIAASKHPGRSICIPSPTARYLVTYSPPQPRHAWSTWRYRPSKGFHLLEWPSLEMKWELDPTQQYAMVFANDGNRVIVAPNTDDAVYIHDSETGKVQQTIRVGHSGTALEVPQLTVSKDGKHLLIQQSNAAGNGWAVAGEAPIWRRVLQWLRIDPEDPARTRDLTIVYDLETNRERLRLRGWKIDEALLSDDGTTLITTHTDEQHTRVMRCWDVSSTKPWRSPLAVPATLGVLLWGLARGVTRWRTRTPAAVAKSA